MISSVIGIGGGGSCGGLRVIELAPAEEESLGFDVCLGPTGTFVMCSYVEEDSLVYARGMRAGDELVSVNDISFKMMSIDEAVDILSSQATLRLVLQKSGFLPPPPPPPLQQIEQLEQNGDEEAKEVATEQVEEEEAAAVIQADR